MSNEKETTQKKRHYVRADQYELLQKVIKGEMTFIAKEEYERIRYLDYYQLEINERTIEAMANLEDYGPTDIANLVSFVICQSIYHLPEDETGLSIKAIPMLLKLQEFLYTWGEDYAGRQALFFAQQEEDGLAEDVKK